MKKLFILALLITGVMLTANAWAEADLGFKGIGVKVGLVDAEDVDATIGFGGFVDLGTIAPKIKLVTGVDYWSKTEDIILGEATLSDIVIYGNANYFLSESEFRPYVGGGLSVNLIKVETKDNDLIGDGASNSETKLGFDLAGGVLYQMGGKTDFLGEFKYRLVDGANQMSIMAGIVFNMGDR